jgi:hypothetical protein
MERTDPSAFRRALLDADPQLSRFDPMSRILSFDDFDRGFCGWGQLVGNYEHTLDAMLPGYAQHSQPMLSSIPHWDAGSHGGVDGTYALKIATRPNKGAQNCAIKRMTFRKSGPIRIEAYVAAKPEANELLLSLADVRSFGIFLDLQSMASSGASAERVMPHLRYLNAFDGELRQAWQTKRHETSFVAVGNTGDTLSHYHLSPEGWEDLSGGGDRLCYNELPTKLNWTYLRLDFDLDRMVPLHFQCNEKVFDPDAVGSIRMPAMKNLWGMLNFGFLVETDSDKRAFLYVDSVCISAEF